MKEIEKIYDVNLLAKNGNNTLITFAAVQSNASLQGSLTIQGVKRRADATIVHLLSIYMQHACVRTCALNMYVFGHVFEHVSGCAGGRLECASMLLRAWIYPGTS